MPTVKQLRAEAKAMGLHDYSRLRKAELIHKIDKVKGKRVVRSPKPTKPIPKPRTRVPIPKPRTRVPIPKPRTRVPIPKPPLYTEEVLPSYEEAASDLPPNYYKEIIPVRKAIIKHFPERYLNNEKEFYKDWDKDISDAIPNKDTKGLAKFIKRGAVDWKGKRILLLVHSHLKSIMKVSKTPVSEAYVALIAEQIYGNMFKGRQIQQQHQVAMMLHDMGTLSEVNSAHQVWVEKTILLKKMIRPLHLASQLDLKKIAKSLKQK